MFDCNNKHGIYNLYQVFTKKNIYIYIIYVIFAQGCNYLLWRKKVINCKNNYKYNKLDNVWLDNINQINCKILVVMLHI